MTRTVIPIKSAALETGHTELGVLHNVNGIHTYVLNAVFNASCGMRLRGGGGRTYWLVT